MIARPTDAQRGWRGRVRAYCAAVMLTTALFGAPPRGRVVESPAIVQVTGRPHAGFDPRELAAPSVALTLPLPLDPDGASTPPPSSADAAARLN